MFNVFDQPWTLLIAAAIVLRIFNVLLTDTSRWWQWYPLMLLIGGVYLLGLLDKMDVLGASTSTIAILQITVDSVIIILFAIPFILAVAEKEKHRWLWLIPLCLAASAFALDGFIKTDLEAINELIQNAIDSAEQENAAGIDAILSDDYRDSYHNSKEQLMRYCRMLFSEPLIEKNKKRGLAVEISGTEAVAVLTVLTIFDENSFVRRQYFKPTLLTKLKLHLRKTAGGGWLIDSAEITSIDGRPASWNLIR